MQRIVGFQVCADAEAPVASTSYGEAGAADLGSVGAGAYSSEDAVRRVERRRSSTSSLGSCLSETELAPGTLTQCFRMQHVMSERARNAMLFHSLMAQPQSANALAGLFRPDQGASCKPSRSQADTGDSLWSVLQQGCEDQAMSSGSDDFSSPGPFLARLDAAHRMHDL